MTIATNLEIVQAHIDAACAKVNRDSSSVTLVAVSKTQSDHAVLEAIASGVKHFGENRVEEGSQKIPLVNNQSWVPVTWHMIGHIQSRKAKDVLPLFQVVHSVDSLKIAERLSRLAAEAEKRVDVLIEINVSGEATKAGFVAAGWPKNSAMREHLWQSFGQIIALPGLNVRGLMTMAPIVQQMEMARPVFGRLAELCEALATAFEITLPDLSMGMTDDYPVAVEEGATIVRIGRAIFGETSI
jgi:pyridoxal phosphate enzyme (YggS family)